MKKILFIAAMLSFLAFNSCQDNTIPEGGTEGTENSTENGSDDGTENGSDDGTENGSDDGTDDGTGDGTDVGTTPAPVGGEGSYTIGDLSGEVTSAYYGISEDGGSCRIVLSLDDVVFSLSPPMNFFDFSLKLSDPATGLQPGTYTVSDSSISAGKYIFYDGETDTYLGIKSGTIEISAAGDCYTITVSGTFSPNPSAPITTNDRVVSATYTGPLTEIDYESGYVLGSGTYSIGDTSGSLRYAYARNRGYDEVDEETEFDLYIYTESVTVDGIDGFYYFWFNFTYYGQVAELQSGTFTAGESGIITTYGSYIFSDGNMSTYYYPEPMTIEISKKGGSNYQFKVNGVFDAKKVSADFSGYVTYR